MRKNITSKKSISLDPVTMSVIHHRLEWINKEMGVVMLRASKNPIFAEVHDFSCAICDWKPRMVSQVDGVPSHTAATMIVAETILEKFKTDILDGDVFLMNEPYMGGTHIADITVVKPVFHQGEIVFVAINRAHHSDVGGLTMGSYSPLSTEIFHEGIRIPPLRIYRDNKQIKDVLDLIALNTRLPDLIISDIKAQVGSCFVAERRLHDLIVKYSVQKLKDNIEAILDYSEHLMRSEIRKIPNGEYEGETYLDSDGFQNEPVRIYASVTVSDDKITIDFTGSALQTTGFINSPFGNTITNAYIGVLTTVDPAIPHNEGAYRPIKIIAPEGSILNPRPPAPVADCTLDTASAIIEATWIALSKALPHRAPAGWARWCGPAISGIDPRTGKLYVMHAFCVAGGAGATPTMDGWNYLNDAADLGGMTFPNIESNETQYPHFTEYHEFLMDSGGPGQYRGGLGVRYKIRLYDEHPLLAMFGDGVVIPPYGLHSGKPGKPNRPLLNEGTPHEKQLPAKGLAKCRSNETFSSYSAGGGGWGDPKKRDAEKVRADVTNGFVSLESAKRDYGVILDPVTFEVKGLER